MDVSNLKATHFVKKTFWKNLNCLQKISFQTLEIVLFRSIAYPRLIDLLSPQPSRGQLRTLEFRKKGGVKKRKFAEEYLQY